MMYENNIQTHIVSRIETIECKFAMKKCVKTNSIFENVLNLVSDLAFLFC